MDLFPHLTLLRLFDFTFALLALYLIKRLINRSLLSRKRYKLPPGPKPLPLVGNLFDYPKDLEWVQWATYKDIYGPISSITSFGRTLIFLNDLKTAQDLFETRSSIYSNRSILTFSGDLCGWNGATSYLQYDDECKTHRRLMHRLMGTPAAVDSYCDLIEKQTHSFLHRVLQRSEEFCDHIDLFVGAITLRMLYGYEVQTASLDGANDPLVKVARKTSFEFVDANIPGKWLVDTLPFLRHIPSWLPGTKFRTIGKIYKSHLAEFMQRPIAFVQREMRDGTALRSYTADLLESNSANPDPWLESVIKYSAASLYLAGTDTTISTTRTFFLAMMLNPSVQKKAQEEIDRVVSADWLPKSEDRPNLPYVNAIVKETMRWNPPVPLGIPHAPSEDDVYQGYDFPKGSTIIPNIWQFTRDPNNYADPLEFKPERFLGSELSGGTPEPDPHDIVFGFGRRECPGKLVASMELFYVVSSSLSVFNIERPVDEHGNPIEEKYEFDSTGLLNHPKKFKCTITPRSKAAEELIATFAAEALYDSGHAEKILGM